MNILSRFTFRAFIGPFLITFAVVQFLLLMQFLWKYIDDLVGKGLEWYLVVELMVYTSASIVPLSLPLAVLLSAIMTFGKMGEQYELIGLKSTGISFFRIMLPLTFAMALLSFGAFLFNNYVIPQANLKSGALLWDITQKKPSFNLEPGQFYKGIEGYSIRIGSKSGEDGSQLSDVIIYDHSDNRGNSKVIRAERGLMYSDEAQQLLIFELLNGTSYEELKPESSKDRNRHPFLRTQFEREIIRFDLSHFQMSRTDEGLFKNDFRMQNLRELDYNTDTLRTKYQSVVQRMSDRIRLKYSAFDQKPDSVNQPVPRKIIERSALQFQSDEPAGEGHWIDRYSKANQRRILQTALNLARSAKSHVASHHKEVDWRRLIIARHRIEWHKKITLSAAVLMLFLVGAPLGGIIRKGGLGMPVVVAIIIFLAYHILTTMAEKLGRDYVLDPDWAMWLPLAVFFPMGIYLTYKSSADSRMFDMERYTGWLRKLRGRKTSNL